MSDEQTILNRISMARGNAEPEPEPTAEPEAVDVSEEMPGDVVESVEEVAEDASDVEADDNPEELAGDEVVDSDDSDDDEGLYVEYKGREINLKDVYETEQGQLRQADYTRKTQELADERKAFAEEREKFNDHQSKLGETIAILESIIAEETLSPDAVAELREYEPEEYIKYQEKIQARSDALAKAKEIQPTSNVDIQSERQKLWDANPSWLENGEQTKAFKEDMARLEGYAKENGYSDAEIANITSAHHWQTLLDAAKYREMSKKNVAIEKKVRKAPVTTKPRAATKTNLQDKIVKAQERLKQTGKTEDAVILRQLKRQLQG